MQIFLLICIFVKLSMSRYSLEKYDLDGIKSSFEGWNGINYLKEIDEKEFIFTNSNLTKTFQFSIKQSQNLNFIIGFEIWKTQAQQTIQIKAGDELIYPKLLNSIDQQRELIRIQTKRLELTNSSLTIDISSNSGFGISQFFILIYKYFQDCQVQIYDTCHYCDNNFEKKDAECHCSKLLDNYQCQEECSSNKVQLNSQFCISQKYISLIHSNQTTNLTLYKEQYSNQSIMNETYQPELIINMDNQLQTIRQYIEFDLINTNYSGLLPLMISLNINKEVYLYLITGFQMIVNRGDLIKQQHCNYSENCMQVRIRSHLFKQQQNNQLQISLGYDNLTNLKLNLTQQLQDFNQIWTLTNLTVYGVSNISETCQNIHCKECCVNSNECIICEEGYFLNNKFCVDKCPFNSKIINNTCIDQKPQFTNYILKKGPYDYNVEFDQQYLIIKDNELLYRITQKNPFTLKYNLFENIIGISIKIKMYLVNKKMNNNKIAFQINYKSFIIEVTEKEYIFEDYIKSANINLIIVPRTKQLEIHIQSIIILSYQCHPHCQKCTDQQSCEKYDTKSIHLFDINTMTCKEGYKLSEDQYFCETEFGCLK